MKSLFLLIYALTVSVCYDSSALTVAYPESVDSLKILEKAYLHTDRDNYYPGDDIWFKAYLIEAIDRTLTDHSRNLHVELISPDSKIVLSRIIRIQNGLGNGDFHLSDTMKSGRYLLRAYTNYMRNFGDQLFFKKIITIINPSDAIRELSELTDNKRNKFDISFFPEGGSLTDSVLCMVAFKADNLSGRGIDVTGEIHSSDGQFVTSYKSTHNGMGVFTLNPVAGKTYYAVSKNLYGDTVVSQLPQSLTNGIAMSVYRNKENSLVATLKTNSKTLTQIADSDLVLTVSAHNIEFMSLNIRIESAENIFTLPYDNLPEGIYTLTLKSPVFGPLCERLIYAGSSEKVKLNLSTDKVVYNQRDSVCLRVSVSGKDEKSQKAFLSVSSSKLISSKKLVQNATSIASWFLLESEIKGEVEDASYYFDSSNPDRLKDLDLLLLTQGWRDFKWKYKKQEFGIENGFGFSGRIRKKFADEPIKNSKINIGLFKDGKPAFALVPTDSTGRFRLDGIDLTGRARLIASAAGESDRLQGILMLDSINYIPPEAQAAGNQFRSSGKKNPVYADNKYTDDNSSVNESIQAYLQFSEIKKSIAKKYKLSDTITPGEVTVIAKKNDNPKSAAARSRHYLMGNADISIIVTSNMEAYGTVRQLLRRNPIFTVEMERIIYVIDGVKVSGDMLMAFPVNRIARVDLLNTLAAISIFGPNTEYIKYQDKVANGVIAITTKNEGDFNYSDKVLLHSSNINISGYDESRIFYSPKHHANLQSDYKPDLRTTLLWEPDIKVEDNLEKVLNYYNADNPSLVRVSVEGITSDGIPVTGKLEYEVK